MDYDTFVKRRAAFERVISIAYPKRGGRRRRCMRINTTERISKEAATYTRNQAVRALGPEAERQGLTEEQAVEEMKQIRIGQ